MVSSEDFPNKNQFIGVKILKWWPEVLTFQTDLLHPLLSRLDMAGQAPGHASCNELAQPQLSRKSSNETYVCI
jgi:hypothetical protein